MFLLDSDRSEEYIDFTMYVFIFLFELFNFLTEKAVSFIKCSTFSENIQDLVNALRSDFFFIFFIIDKNRENLR